MKLAALLLTIGAIPVCANGFSQNVTLKERNVRLETVFRKIEQQTGYYFWYEGKNLQDAKRLNLSLQKVPLREALDQCLEGQPFSYVIVDKTIVIKNRKELPPVHSEKEIAAAPIAIEVSGVVTDETGAPLSGASISVKGSSTGTSTDQNGRFSIEVPGANTVLVISYVGMLAQEVTVKGSAELKITMIRAVAEQQEVVLVGYGKQRKVNVTGSVVSVKGEDLAKRQVVNPVAALQGLLPGVAITQNSGQPGAENLAIQIRGMTTYSSAGSAPLVLINGVPGALSDLNPSVIENISILKDAASASIYGARAANGVILVTTKNGAGSNGKLNVNYSFTTQFNKATRLPDLVTNSVAYMELFNQAKRNSGATSQFYPQSVIDLYKDPADPLKYPNADWAALMFRTAPTYMHTLSVNGGTRQTSYDFTVGYVDQQGTMRAFNYKKYNAMLNLASEIGTRLKTGIMIGLKSGDRSQPRNGAEDAFYQTLAHPPTALPWLPDGSGRYTYRTYAWEFVRPNQFAANEQLSRNIDYAVNAQVWADVKIAKGFNWFTKAALNGYANRFKEFSETVPLYGYLNPDDAGSSSNIPGNGLSTSMDQTIYKNLYTYLEYDNRLGLHHFAAQAGYNQEQERYYVLSGSRTSYSVGGALQELNGGDATPQYNNGTSTEWALKSGFGRLKYDYAGKYLFESNLRYDGSSRLSEKNRWGVFPSFSAGWRVGEEGFMQELRNSGIINELKIRGSWGKLGNQNIGLYPYQALLNVGNNYPFGTTLATGVYQSALNNDKITWETTTMTDIGLELRLWRHLSIAFDYYKKTTTDILRTAQVTGVVGLSAPIINDGAMTNKGMDLSLNYDNKVGSGALSGLVYSAGFNISGFRNATTKFGELQDNSATVIREGLPWNSFYLLQWDGIFQSQAEVDAAPKQFGETTQPGDLRFRDINGDNVIDNNDRVIMKDGVFPSYTYGLTLNAAWKGVDFYAFFQGVQGLKGLFGYNRAPGLTPFFSGVPPLKEIADQAWTPENQSTTMPQLYFSDMAASAKVWNHPSTFLLRDMSYLRVKQLQLGYSVPEKAIQRLKLNAVRVFVSGENLFTFTKFLGTDPEKPAGTYLSYPQNKVISLGLSVKL